MELLIRHHRLSKAAGRVEVIVPVLAGGPLRLNFAPFVPNFLRGSPLRCRLVPVPYPNLLANS